jgi:phage terminase large subunit-like protein
MSDFTAELIQYCNDCLSDKILSCKKLKWACQRFLNDLDRQGKDGFPYVFEEFQALRFLDWMELFKHRKGPLAGAQKIPHITEKFEFGNIYGWVHKDTGRRRFRTAYLQKARKNAKSQDLAIVALYEESAFGEQSSEVYIGATKRDQTRHVWEEADWLYKHCDFLKDKFKTRYGIIEHPKSDSKFIRLSKDDKKSGDGSNPQCGILDEYHEHDTTEYYDMLTSGMKTRSQPLLIIITTAGSNLSYPCYREEYDYISKILNPDIEVNNDRYFACVYELDKNNEGELIDDVKDEKIWIKANPIIAESPEAIENIRAELTIALDKPEKMRDFLTKTMDVWVNQRAAGYMQMGKWKACGATKENPFPDVSKKRVIGGLDLAATTDLASIDFEIDLGEEKVAVLSHSFMPEESFERHKRTDKVPYETWEKQGWITVTPGAVIDYDFILDYIEKEYIKYSWVKGEICFDRYLATWLTQRLSERGFIPVDIAQGIPTLGEPTKNFRDRAYSGKVIHDNNPVLSWAMSNAVTRKDANGNFMLDKEHSIEHIDPAAALMNAHVRMVLKPLVTSPYEKHGLRSLSD